MGKSQKKSRLASARANPFPAAANLAIATRSNKFSNLAATAAGSQEIGNGSANEGVTAKAANLLSQLTSETVPVSQKTIVLRSITVMCNDSSLREEFIKQNLFGIICNNNPANASISNGNGNETQQQQHEQAAKKCFLNTSSLEVLNQSLELIKVIAFEDGYPICTHLWKKRKIWTFIALNLENLKNSFNQYSVNSLQFSKNETDLLFELTENLFGLIISLINGSDNILDEFLDKEASNDKMNLVIEFLANLLIWTINVDDSQLSNDKPTLKISLRLLNSILGLFYYFSSESSGFVQRLVFDFGFKLFHLIRFADLMNSQINNATKVYIEGIKFQIVEIIGLSSSPVPPTTNNNDDEIVDDDTEEAGILSEAREALFAEIYGNLSLFLKEKLSLDQAYAQSQLNLNDYLPSAALSPSAATVLPDSSKFAQKYQQKIDATDDIHAAEIAMDLITTIIEFAGTNPELVQRVQDKQHGVSDIRVPKSSFAENKQAKAANDKLLEYFNNNALVGAFADAEFYKFLFDCLLKYDLKFELRALDCLNNLAVLFGSLQVDDHPEVWRSQVHNIWSFFSSNNNTKNNTLVSPLFREINTSDKQAVIYDIHLRTKVVNLLNATVAAIDIYTYPIASLLEAVISTFSYIAKAHSDILQQKKQKNNAENKEILDIVNDFYMEAFQFLAVFAQLPAPLTEQGNANKTPDLCIQINSAVGDFFLTNVLNPDSQAISNSQSMLSFLDTGLVIELLSLVFDIYGDAAYEYDEPVFVQKGYLGVLKQIKEVLKTVVFKKIDKNQEPELKSLAFDALKELERFIKYKASEKS